MLIIMAAAESCFNAVDWVSFGTKFLSERRGSVMLSTIRL